MIGEKNLDNKTVYRADELKVGDKLLTQKGNKLISAIERFNGEFEVYNLSCKKYHTFLILDSGIVVQGFGDESFNLSKR